MWDVAKENKIEVFKSICFHHSLVNENDNIIKIVEELEVIVLDYYKYCKPTKCQCDRGLETVFIMPANIINSIKLPCLRCFCLMKDIDFYDILSGNI